jgi:hypothetical protein
MFREGPRNTGEEPLDDLMASGEQAVRVAALGDAFPVLGAVGERVSLDERHPREMLREDSGREEPGDAAPNDERV